MTFQTRKERLEAAIQQIRERQPPCFHQKFQFSLVDCADTPSATFRFATEPWMCNLGGVVQGGIVSTLCDMGMGILSFVESGRYTPTVQLAVSFLAPVPLNNTVLVRAHITRAGHRILHTNCEVLREDTGECCATATGIFYVKSPA